MIKVQQREVGSLHGATWHPIGNLTHEWFYDRTNIGHSGRKYRKPRKGESLGDVEAPARLVDSRSILQQPPLPPGPSLATRVYCENDSDFTRSINAEQWTKSTKRLIQRIHLNPETSFHNKRQNIIFWLNVFFTIRLLLHNVYILIIFSFLLDFRWKRKKAIWLKLSLDLRYFMYDESILLIFNFFAFLIEETKDRLSVS